jgi:hypothetical protein
MKKIMFALIMTSALGLGMLGCKFDASFNTASTPAPAKPSDTTAAKTNSNSVKTDKKTQTALKNEKKPEGDSKKANSNPVPGSWLYVYDATKGYGFYVPEGTTGGSETVDGVDTFVASTPAPSEIGVVVIAFKDKTMTKDDLLNLGVKFLEEMGETVTPGKLTGESDDYAVADVTTTSKDGAKGKGKILVGTDVTDNYVMLVGVDESKFAANEKIIDEIWGSFEMWSGGASSN